MSKPIFLLVVNERCMYCPAALETFRTMMDDPEVNSILEPQIINLPDYSGRLDDSFNPIFRQYIMWFPCFMIIQRDSWKKIIKTPDAMRCDIVCSIFNGRVVGGRAEFIGIGTPMTRGNLTVWIQDRQRGQPELFLNLDPVDIELRKSYLKEIPNVYHILTLAPFWANDTTGNFKPHEQKSISSCYLPALLSIQQKYRDQKATLEEVRYDLLALGIPEYLYKDIDLKYTGHVLEKSIELIINRHYV